jgi:hypothetical protein
VAVCALTVWSVGVAAVPAGAADRVVVTNPGFNVDAFNGTFAWSQLVGCESPGAPCVNRLEFLSGGERRFAPVRSFGSAPVDPKLGPGRDGSSIAAYSRCKGSFLRGCDLFVLGLRSGRERKLRSLSTRRRSEYAVAPWEGRYLFSRSWPGGGVFASPPLRRISSAFAPDVDLRGGLAAFITRNRRSFRNSIRVVRLPRRGRGRQLRRGHRR